jgi:hypothetical protein
MEVEDQGFPSCYKALVADLPYPLMNTTGEASLNR